MIGSWSAQRISNEGRDPNSFLASNRGLAACAREFAQLSGEIVRGLVALHDGGLPEKPVVRQSPGRCIVQLGPVALTLSWLRSTIDTAADGQLLVIVWRGAVAPRGDFKPERADTHRVRLAATALSEDVLVAVAPTPDDWTWWPEHAEAGGYSSKALAEKYVSRLYAAYENAMVTEGTGRA